MKVHNASIRLNVFGKPEFCFEIEPETDLEWDAMKAADYCNQEHHVDEMKDMMTAIPQRFTPEEEEKRKFSGMRIWTSWQISHERFHQRKSGK